MTDELVIISPELIPGAGGVGDYTLRLLETWDYRGNLKLLVPKAGFGVAKSSGNYRVEKLGHDAAAICRQLPPERGKVLLQYSAYGFSRLGYPQKLLRALIDWKSKKRGLLIVMFHEIWTFWPTFNKNAVLQFFHRRVIKQLLSRADAVFTTTTSQADHLQKLMASGSVQVLPVGSNVRRNEDVDLPRKPGWAVLFGIESSRIRALKKLENTLNALVRAGRITKIVTIGALEVDEERRLLEKFGLVEGFEQQGRQSARDVSEALLTASFGIFAQNELSYGKSGTFMAYAAHGLNVIAECADPAREEPLCLLVAPAELLDGLSPSKLHERAERLRAWQQRISSWESIAAKFADALQLEITRASHQVASR